MAGRTEKFTDPIVTNALNELTRLAIVNRGAPTVERIADLVQQIIKQLKLSGENHV
jgi:hypothetical protein